MSKPKTVKVRVAVAVDREGDWCAGPVIEQYGADEAFKWIIDDLASGEARYILTAELEIPEPREVAAEVEQGVTGLDVVA